MRRLEVDPFLDVICIVVEHGVFQVNIRTIGNQVLQFGLVAWVFWEILCEYGVEIVIKPFASCL